MKVTRRSLLGGIAVAGASASVGAGTFAYLKDESESEITINVGSLSLADPTPIEWSEDPTTDGEDSFSDRLTITNTGNLPSRQVLLVDLSVNDWNLAKALKIKDVRYGQDTMSSILEDIEETHNDNEIYDLHDLGTTLNEKNFDLEELAGQGTLHAENEAHLEIDAVFDYSQIPDSKDDKDLEATLTVRGRQQDSSDSS